MSLFVFISSPSLFIFREIVDYLLANGASLIVHDLVTKRTPLHAAGMRNNNNNNNNNNNYLSLSPPRDSW